MLDIHESWNENGQRLVGTFTVLMQVCTWTASSPHSPWQLSKVPTASAEDRLHPSSSTDRHPCKSLQGVGAMLFNRERRLFPGDVNCSFQLSVLCYGIVLGRCRSTATCCIDGNDDYQLAFCFNSKKALSTTLAAANLFHSKVMGHTLH